jgi:hypothetical protein
MANNNNPHGLMSLGLTLGGGAIFIEEFQKAVGYATALFRQDAVNRVSGGAIEASATPGTTLYSGVVMNRGAASTASSHAVIVNPDALYEAQCGVAGLLVTDMGVNANLLLSAGNATTGASGHIINTTGIAVTATLDVKLLQLFNISGNAYGPYARIEVMFNKHRMAPASVGV